MTLYQRALFRLRALKLEALYLSREAVNRRINTVSERQRAAMRLRISTYKGPMAERYAQLPTPPLDERP